MPLTPLDIRNKSFTTQLRGFSQREVKSFLELTAKEIEELRKERGMLAEKCDELAARLETHERTEGLLKETLMTAQKTTEEMRSAAQDRANSLLTQAKQDAESQLAQARERAAEMIRDTERQLADLRQELSRVNAERISTLQQIRGIAQSYIALVERWEKEPRKPQDD